MDDKLVPNVKVFMDEEVVDPVVEEGAEEAPAAEAPTDVEETEAPEEEAAEEAVEEAEAESPVEEEAAEEDPEEPVEEVEEDPAADIVAQIEALEDEDPGAEIDAKIDVLKAEAELARLSEDAVVMLEGRLREIWLADFTEGEQAKLIKSFIPTVRAKGKKKLLPIDKITDLRFFAKDSEKVFYLSMVKRGHFHLKVFHNPGA